MKLKLTVLIVLAITLGSGAYALADTQPMGHGIARTSMVRLAGDWKGAGTMAAAGSSNPVTAHWNCESGASGFAIRCDMHITGVPGLEELTENEQIGFDNSEQQVHMGTVCNGGEAHDLRGNWEGNTLRVEDDRESFELQVVSARELRAHVVNKGGGPVFDLRLQR